MVVYVHVLDSSAMILAVNFEASAFNCIETAEAHSCSGLRLVRSDLEEHPHPGERLCETCALRRGERRGAQNITSVQGEEVRYLRPGRRLHEMRPKEQREDEREEQEEGREQRGKDDDTQLAKTVPALVFVKAPSLAWCSHQSAPLHVNGFPIITGQDELGLSSSCVIAQGLQPDDVNCCRDLVHLNCMLS